VANLLTLIRLLLAVPVALAFADAELMRPPLLVALIALAIATDYFDGIVARANHSVSPRGQLFDHSTDFLFVTSALVGASMADLVNPLLPALIVLAFAQYVLDSRFLFRDKRLRMNFLGRWNGILYFVPLVLIALSRLASLENFEELLRMLTVAMCYGLMISTVASITDRAHALYKPIVEAD
jgi:phosphatidylglycerophosphate synthase